MDDRFSWQCYLLFVNTLTPTLLYLILHTYTYTNTYSYAHIELIEKYDNAARLWQLLYETLLVEMQVPGYADRFDGTDSGKIGNSCDDSNSDNSNDVNGVWSSKKTLLSFCFYIYWSLFFLSSLYVFLFVALIKSFIYTPIYLPPLSITLSSSFSTVFFFSPLPSFLVLFLPFPLAGNKRLSNGSGDEEDDEDEYDPDDMMSEDVRLKMT